MPFKAVRRAEFNLPRLIVCEGGADAAFLRALIKARDLPEFHIRNPQDRGEMARGGIDQIGDYMAGFYITPGFAQLTEILIIANSDINPITNFQKVCAQVAAVSTFKFEVPITPLKRTAGVPGVTIALLPWHDEPGNLESFCLEAAKFASPAASACVEIFATCTGAETWVEQTKRGKMKLRSILAAQHKRDPFIGIGKVWREAAHLIPLSHSSFDRLSSILESFR